jgi:hypothetical protein
MGSARPPACHGRCTKRPSSFFLGWLGVLSPWMLLRWFLAVHAHRHALLLFFLGQHKKQASIDVHVLDQLTSPNKRAFNARPDGAHPPATYVCLASLARHATYGRTTARVPGSLASFVYSLPCSHLRPMQRNMPPSFLGDKSCSNTTTAVCVSGSTATDGRDHARRQPHRRPLNSVILSSFLYTRPPPKNCLHY